MLRRILYVALGSATLVSIMAFIPPAMYSSPSGKYRIGMAGRSTMDHWFKSWNWPYMVHRYAIWRQWPIPYQKYAKGKYYFELLPVPGPTFSEDPNANGLEMFDAVASQADPQRYDALLFKFCFVDFDERDMSPESREKRLREMSALVERVHALTRERKMKLVLGTALPVQHPAPESGRLRSEFTEWIDSYARGKRDLAVVDLYRPLVDADGHLRPDFARAPYDDHVNWAGFRQLDRGLFPALDSLFTTSDVRR